MKRLSFAFLGLIIITLIPILNNEITCKQPLNLAQTTYKPLLPPSFQRAFVDSPLTYPEWSIVYAYEDFARVSRAKGEENFNYITPIYGFWKDLCTLTTYTSPFQAMSLDTKSMLYVIGVSFSAELLMKGLYEKTIGQISALTKTQTPTQEDLLSHQVNDDYVEFLAQNPWYLYDFSQKANQIWALPFWGEGNYIRKIERRIGLSLEWRFKAGYAKLINMGAQLAPAALTLRSVVKAKTLPNLPNLKIIEQTQEAITIETPRYRAFTHLLQNLAKTDAEIIEIAGNDKVFLTLIAPNTARSRLPPQVLIETPLQGLEDYKRFGFVMNVNLLLPFIRDINQFNAQNNSAGIKLEHIYDY